MTQLLVEDLGSSYLVVEGDDEDGIILVAPGIQGPPGPPGSPVKFSVTSPAATWTIAHGFAHVPMVEVYDSSGNEIIVDKYVDATHIVCTFANPSTGFVLAI